MTPASHHDSKLSVAVALAVSLFGHPVGGATISDELALTRANQIRLAVSGCMAGIIDPGVIRYMQRAEQEGKPFASKAEAEADMTGNPKWKTEIEPMIRTTCECSLSREIDSIQTAQSAEAIQKIFSDLATRLNDPATSQAEAVKFAERCAQPLVRKLDERK